MVASSYGINIEEDNMKLSEETKRHIKQAEKDIKEGRTVSFDKVKKELGLHKKMYNKYK